MELGITGHPTRGDEVIKILEMLGGKNCCYRLTGYSDKYFYYNSYEYKYICNSYIGPDEIKGYKIFSLEDFLEKYPYKVGDKVNVYVQNDYIEGMYDIEVAEITSMRWDPTRCRIVYKMKDIDGEFCADDIKDKVNDDEEQKNDPTIDYVELVNKTYEEEAGKMCAEITMDTLYKNGITFEYLKDRGYDLPEGHHFVDENGKTIDAKKIKLVKNAPYYPKTYEECCKVSGIDVSRKFTYEDMPFYENCSFYENDILKKFEALRKLIICRDAYWKIAGEQMELGKPWRPVWDESEDLYTIHTFNGEIRLSGTAHRNAILVFPTEEMRDTFDVNFENLIEQCKELL